jgi:proteasome lid subunit RPN8/RPN11
VSLKLNRAVEEIVVQTCRKAFPEEGCGLLIGPIPDTFDTIGRALEVDEARPLPNGWDESAKTNKYLIDPKALAKVEMELSGSGRGVIGFFHSHPTVPAWPSPFDLTMAMPCCSYWILQVKDGNVVDSRSWQRTEDGRSFVEEEIILEG